MPGTTPVATATVPRATAAETPSSPVFTGATAFFLRRRCEPFPGRREPALGVKPSLRNAAVSWSGNVVVPVIRSSSSEANR